jgi:hypothetical protein
MTKKFELPDAKAVEEIRRIAERPMSREEFDAYVDAPMSSDELEGDLDLIRWFAHRFPTPRARLAQARKVAARLAVHRPRHDQRS